MRYETIDSALFIKNRKKFAPLLKPNSIAIFHSNDVMPTNADGVMAFKQNSDLFYLSGIDQEETVLILYPDAVNEKHREILLVRKTDQHIAVWEGEKLNKEQATLTSGINTVLWTEQYHSLLETLLPQVDHIYLNSNEHARACRDTETRNDRLGKELRKNFPLYKIERAAPIMHELRAKKEAIEVAQIRKACEITRDGFLRVLKSTKPGIGEWQLEADYLHTFLSQKSRGFAYTPIIGSGSNANILHYVQNNSICKDGDLILMDVAAEYANWNADMTRTIPTNGKYSKRQRSVYDAVLRVHHAANAILRPGITMVNYQAQVLEFMEEELIKLGLFTSAEAKTQKEDKHLVKRYFMHGTSHHLGLDVHDVSTANAPVAVGNMFTIEPGIYIREENIGIRLENNFYIGETKNEDLMHDIPIEAEEIEEIMASGI